MFYYGRYFEWAREQSNFFECIAEWYVRGHKFLGHECTCLGLNVDIITYL